MPDMKENYVLIEKMDRQPISNRRNVSKVMKQKRQECPERITNEYGNQLRMNRSIQAERLFADVKEDMNFRRYLYRGKRMRWHRVSFLQSEEISISYSPGIRQMLICVACNCGVLLIN